MERIQELAQLRMEVEDALTKMQAENARGQESRSLSHEDSHSLRDDTFDGVGTVGRSFGRKLIATVAGLAVTAIIGSGAVFLWPDRQAVAVGVPTWTPAPAQIQPASTRPAVQIVEVQPQETEADRIIMEQISRLTTALDNLAAEVHVSSGIQAPVAAVVPVSGGPGVVAPIEAESAPVPTPAPSVNVWEDGNCWTPGVATVLHLCGAAESDGYVIRWVGVSGDNTGPQIPDADWHAVRSTGDRLVWAGVHPVTGDAVTIDYWAGGHVLAVRVVGSLLFRIDRRHEVIQ